MLLRTKPRIAIPVPTSSDLAYNQRSWKQYALAVSDAGGIPVEVRLEITAAELRAQIATCQGVCLPGSPADVDPARYGAERDEATAPTDSAREALDFSLLDWAAKEAMPVLGICFGLQSLNVWCGGSLVQDLQVLPVNHAAGGSVAVAHSVLVPPGSALAALLGSGEAPLREDFLRLPVNTSHHQAVSSPGDGLRIVARCPDDGVIEALELDASVASERGFPSWLLGVQWHPERSTAISAASRAIFRKLIMEAAGARSKIAAAGTVAR